MKRALLLVGLIACGGDLDAGGDDDAPVNDAPTGGDAAPACDTFIDFEPDTPVAGPATMVRANAKVFNSPGVVGYTWGVTFQGAPVGTMFVQDDESAIQFPAVTAGVYTVRLSVDSVVFCPDEVVDFNVLADNANTTQVRLHATPPPSAGAPPLDKLVPVIGGAPFSLGNVIVDPGIEVTNQVRQATAGVAAYLRFLPAGMEAAVESYASPVTGMFTVRVLNQVHDVLVVPASTNIAPQLIRGWTPGMPIALGGSTAVSGTVTNAGGTPIAGAKVQLTIGGVPSTLATTAANGGFTVLAVPQVGATVTVDVTPPTASGLPRLAASSAFNVAQPVQIAYATLVLRDLAGTTIRRGGNPVANAKLALVGTIAAAGTVTTGGAPVTASGSVRITATANGSGVLPATLAPAKALGTVVETSLNSHAVSAVDLTGGVPATIDAPALQPIATQIRRPDLTGISGVYLELVPVGALAMAGVTSVRLTSSTGGTIATSLAGGGHYELRFNDPAARGAPLIIPDVTSSTIQPAYALRNGLMVSGKLLMPSMMPVGNASVQILCSLCTGFERDRPLAESSSEVGGTFTLVVPDPGTM